MSALAKIYTVAILAVLLAMAGGFVYYEWEISRSESIAIATESSQDLTDALRLGFENAIVSNNEIEQQVLERLNSAALLGIHIGSSSESDLPVLARELGISSIYLFDQSGKAVRSSNGFAGRLSTDLLAEIESEFPDGGTYSELGFITIDSLSQEIYAVVRRFRSGFAIAGYDAERLLEFRKRIGIGKQVAEIGDNPDIAYLMLQDTDGIIAATPNVAEISSIESDTFLLGAYAGTSPKSRTIDFAGKTVLETVCPLQISITGDDQTMLIRSAITMDKSEAMISKSLTRNIALGIGFFLVSGMAFYLGIVRRRFQSLTVEHERHKTLNDMILESISDCVFVIGSDGNILLSNDSCNSFFGRNVSGEAFNSLISGSGFSISDESLPIAFAEAEISAIGQNRSIGYSVSVVLSEDSEFRALVVVFRDLTELKAARTRAERKDKLSAMGELSAQVAHEIRNPINSISIIAQRFLLEFVTTEADDEFRRLAQTVRAEADRVNRIIRQFLEFARPKEIVLSPCRIDDLVRQAVLSLEPEATLNGVTIELNSHQEVLIPADGDQMMQVFINIIRNAIGAMNGGGKLSVSIGTVADCVRIEFADTGAGIPEDLLPKIFNLYFTTKPDGSGLGLSISHRIVTEHGGSITASSTLGVGSRFTVELPIS